MEENIHILKLFFIYLDVQCTLWEITWSLIGRWLRGLSVTLNPIDRQQQIFSSADQTQIRLDLRSDLIRLGLIWIQTSRNIFFLKRLLWKICANNKEIMKITQQAKRQLTLPIDISAAYKREWRKLKFSSTSYNNKDLISVTKPRPDCPDPQIRVCNRKLFFLFFNQNICCLYSKEPSGWVGSFEHPKQMLKLIGKKIITILCSNVLCINLYLWEFLNHLMPERSLAFIFYSKSYKTEWHKVS